MAACIALSLATTLVFGQLPSIRFSRSTMAKAIKNDSSGGGRRVGHVHRLAAAIQVGIALPFLVLGGLLFDGARLAATAKPVAYALAVAAALAVALVASLPSAYRAAAVEPLDAIRAE